MSKVGRLRICQLWKFEWNRRGTESKKEGKMGEKGKNNQCCHDQESNPGTVDN